jgi:hypothetical protein
MRTPFASSFSLRDGFALLAILLGPAEARTGGQAAAQAPPAQPAAVELAVREVPFERAHEGIKWESLTVDREGRRVAYVTGKGAGLSGLALSALFVQKTGSARMVVDGQDSPEYVAVSMPMFSPDGSRVAYAA